MDSSFYPQLPEGAEVEAIKLIDKSKEYLKKTIENVAIEILDKIYSDVAPWVGGDMVGNFQRQIVDAICDYNQLKEFSRWDAKKVRNRIFSEYKEEMVKDLNQDNLEKIKELEEEIIRLKKESRYNY
jgi:hypothetical protein